jgi:hypothetical protein
VAGNRTVATTGESGTLVTRGAARLAVSGAFAAVRPGIGRRAAQQLARRELSRSIYQESVTARILHWLGRLLLRLITDVGSFPGGLWTIVALASALVAAAALVTYWIRPGAGRAGGAGGLLSGSVLSARDHRRQAETSAAAGDYAAAIIERVRGIAVEIEDRGILPARPGLTADELATQAGQALPDLAAGLAAMALLFDDVRYGGRDGTADGYARVRELDASVQAAKAASSGLPEPTAAGVAGPC